MSLYESNPLYGMRQRGARQQPRARTQSRVLAARFPLRRRFEERMRPRSVLDLRKPPRGAEGMLLQPRSGFPRERKQVAVAGSAIYFILDSVLAPFLGL